MEQEIEDIIIGLLCGEKLSPERQLLFDEWMEDENHREQYYKLKRLRASIYACKISEQINLAKNRMEMNQKLKPRRKLRRFLPYAAAVIMALGVGIPVMILKNQKQTPTSVVATASLPVPGQNKVVLTLSTGQHVILSDSLPPMTEQNGTTIRNSKNELVYQPNDTVHQLVYNIITVPRGGEYKLTLSDGSTVWINSESELTYPVSFGNQNRQIRLKGEAFFDIRKDSSRPFIVHTGQFDIQVTGTRFNIRTYPEDFASATLIEGGILLEKDNTQTHLTPGQQASLVNEQILVKEVDTEEAVAWLNDAFCFKQRPLESLLNEIARWYDLEICYQQEEARAYHFSAWFRRSTPIHELIQILEKTGDIKLELKGRTLTVKSKTE